MYKYIHICIYIYMYLYIYVYIYIHTDIYGHSKVFEAHGELLYLIIKTQIKVRCIGLHCITLKNTKDD